MNPKHASHITHMNAVIVKYAWMYAVRMQFGYWRCNKYE